MAVPLDWSSRFVPDTVAPNTLLTRRDILPIMIDGTRHDATMLTFVFEELRPGIEQWGVAVGEPVLYSKHIYDQEHGIYNVQFVLRDDPRPDRVTLIESTPRQADRSLEVLIPFGDERINR